MRDPVGELEGRIRELNSASTTIPPMNALTGLWRGIVTMRRPSDMTMCLPSRTTLNPAFSSARTA